jgi:hypothetical protein
MPDLVGLDHWSALPNYFDPKEPGWEPCKQKTYVINGTL